MAGKRSLDEQPAAAGSSPGSSTNVPAAVDTWFNLSGPHLLHVYYMDSRVAKIPAYLTCNPTSVSSSLFIMTPAGMHLLMVSS